MGRVPRDTVSGYQWVCRHFVPAGIALVSLARCGPAQRGPPVADASGAPKAAGSDDHDGANPHISHVIRKHVAAGLPPHFICLVNVSVSAMTAPLISV